MRLGTIAFLAAALVGITAFSSCTSRDEPYRIHPTAAGTAPTAKEPNCQQVTLIKATAYDETVFENVETKTPNERIKCYLSDYRVPGAAKWRDVENGDNISQPDQYKLSFIEMPENKSGLLMPSQLDDLLATFKRDEQDVVMVYVHGWRHDAAPGNGNAIRFRTMLGYTRSALNARCVETGNYCDAKLTGVYLSWRGRSFAESTKRNAGFPGVIGAVPTVWGRKAQSEKLASEPTAAESVVGTTLKMIEDALLLKSGDATHDKMLVIGHSFGGNMLATYLKPLAEQRILGDQSVPGHRPKTEMKPLLGDLVVLLNPASEAKNWTDIQWAMRRWAEIPDDVNAVSLSGAASAAERAKILKWKQMFPTTQRPFYVSITATKDWNETERRSRPDVKVKADLATGSLFPISSYLAGRFSRERSTTIGHLTPEYRPIMRSDSKLSFYKLAGNPVGTSHELIKNSSANFGGDPSAKRIPTTYSNSGNPKTSWCGSHNGWLKQAHMMKGLNPFSDRWDSGTGGSSSQALLNNMNGATMQIRHELYSEGTYSAAESVAQATSPFWNIRALDTAIYDHSGFINFGTLCTLSLLWLDDATAAVK
jgi:hypothetical protein